MNSLLQTNHPLKSRPCASIFRLSNSNTLSFTRNRNLQEMSIITLLILSSISTCLKGEKPSMRRFHSQSASQSWIKPTWLRPSLRASTSSRPTIRPRCSSHRDWTRTRCPTGSPTRGCTGRTRRSTCRRSFSTEPANTSGCARGAQLVLGRLTLKTSPNVSA